jgi:acyl-CoA synthetase (AMP-forming)/AMP-acid ligase II/nucleoside-diphosphate-sugar epimerase
MTALEMIEAAAGRHADRIAVEDADGRGVTYAELLGRARRAAGAIAAGSIVELAAARTIDFLAGCLAAWLARAAWIPVDPDEPAWRRAAIRAALPARVDDLAYVIATSGSSGAPKLVMVAHRGLPALLRAQCDAFELAPGARALWLHAPRFDASVSDWGTVLAAGATLVIPALDTLAAPARLRGELAGRGITHVDLPPALLAHLPPGDPPPGLRVVVLGGEPCPIEPLCTLARRARVVVVYGPTEATVCSSLQVVDPERWSRPLIGDPLPGVVYRVVDGELWIGGDCLALGYAGDPEATARAFVELDGQRMYRTGDRVEPCDGGLAFAGRIDRQRKLAGVRVDLDEIEAVLRRAPGVREAAVTMTAPGDGGRARVVAFVDGELEPAALRAWMRREAPAWMVPSRVIAGALPRTPTGKIDHGALARRELPAHQAAHADPIERALAALWCDALGVAEVTGERFRDAGGDSLAQLTLAAAAVARGLALDATALAADPTFAELVAAVRGARAASLSVAACEAHGLAALAACREDERERAQPAQAPSIHRARKAPAGLGSVLVTGATGRLGGALLRAWRAHDPRRTIALVRAADPAEARRRFAADHVGVEVICGDVARPYFGLGRDAWQDLADRVSAVVHAAAHIDLAAGWDAHVTANVDGTAEVARFVAARPRIAWHHVSTLSVFVGTDQRTGVHREAATPIPEAIAHGGYAQTKIAAEAIARAMRGRMAPTMILRLGLLVGEAPRAEDQLAMTLRGLARLGAIPAGAAQRCLDLTPLDHAAAAIAALAVRTEWGKFDDTHHLASLHGTTFGQLVAGLGAAGVALDELPADDWAARARARLADPDVAMAYLSLGGDAPPSFDLFLATGADFDVGRTTRLLAEMGVVAPVIDQAFIDRVVVAALRAEADA